ncbi:MAG TPA: asparaginase [Anaerolineae bacterium]|nr:asparaginase [Anaerolineae bacterium]
MPFQTETLVEVIRGGRLESEHRGAIAVVNAAGKLIARVGDVNLTTYLRSSAKPYQLLPLVESGAADRFGFTDQELAIMAGSHSGEARHVEVVQSILNKIGLKEEALQCGAHVPYSSESANTLSSRGKAPTPIYNNCSGKHSGMLAAAIDRGLSTHDYLDPNHPIQITIREAIADVSGVPIDQVGVCIDGCSAPNFALPLKAAALAFAKLAESLPPFTGGDQAGGSPRRMALARIAHAMSTYPEMVAGEKRLDTDLMRAVNGRVVSKGGAEGFHGLGIFSTDGKPAVGLAMKIGDGDGKRGGHPAVIEALRQLDVLSEKELEALKEYRGWKLTNHRGTEVGDVRAKFEMLFAR